jgi:hypothetical protein
MVQAVSGEIAKQRRRLSSPMEQYRLPAGTESARRPGRVQFFGKRVEQVGDDPQVYVVEMDANSDLAPHFHQVDQFQIVVSGNGTFGRKAVAPIALHYADHHTAYGPINAGVGGLSYFTIRARSDPGGIWLDTPESKEMLNRPTKKRHLLPTGIAISTEPVLANRSAVALENLLEKTDDSDGLGAFMLRMGHGMKATGPDPKATGGQFYLVVNGNMQLDGVNYGAWSTIYATPDDMPVEVSAGNEGLEVMILNFPRTQTRRLR